MDRELMLFIDLWKAFDSLQHHLLLVKLNEHGCSCKLIKQIISCFLSEGRYRTKINLDAVIGRIY